MIIVIFINLYGIYYIIILSLFGGGGKIAPGVAQQLRFTELFMFARTRDGVIVVGNSDR